MFRIGLKFPCNGINRVKKHTCSKIYFTARYHGSQSSVKCEPESRLFKDVKLMSRYSGLRYSTESPKSEKKRGGSGGLIAIGAVTLGTLGVLTYAKNDPEFRLTLEQWIPGTDRTIRIIFQEENKYFDIVREFFENIKQTLLKMIFGEVKENEQKAAPKPAFVPLVDVKDAPINEPYSEIRLSKEKGDEIEVVVEKPVKVKKDVPDELKPANLVELETYCGQAASRAIAAYTKATCAIQEYNQDVTKVIETAGKAGAPVWQRLKEATEKRKAALGEAEENAEDAFQSLKRLSSLIDDPQFDAPPVIKSVARRNLKKVVNDVDEAKKKFESEQRSANITERYWKQVKAAREALNEELEILFPNVNINDKRFSVNEEAFDLFVLHMYNKVNYLQKELAKLQTIDEAQLKAALKAVGESAKDEKIEALICNQVNKEKRILEEEFSKKLLEEQKRFDEEMRKQLKLQSQVSSDHLKDALEAKQRETQRAIDRALSEQVEADTNQYKAQLATVVGRLRGLDAALAVRLNEEKGACDAQMLWAACQALARAIKVAPPGATADKAVRPLEPEIKAVYKVAPKEDSLVKATIEGIPEEASKRGVFPEDALRERFLKVENMARRLALVPEEGASLPVYMLSYLQSFLLIKTINPISKSELSDEPIDTSKFNTYDILNRARYWLDRGDFKMTLRYMNLLKGAPRSIARDWMNETRILLETQQAVETLVAYAGSMGLVYLGGGDSKVQQ
ncbi:MICOS complex subunit Mic60 isoform X2 [Venturia canescens]|uniref:MICOS complex subunit Mic60 isoform X2 n=1 Tax=Venturia canescens TaxID=32260 RepID=UPI001C9BFA74|nr:MICOS complex subunit Mic60 isoform X2 [Venturia canescens]